MKKEEMLKAFLKDDYFKEKGYFKSDEEVEKVKWSDYPIDKNDSSKDKLIATIKLVIEGIYDEQKTDDNIKRTVNQYLNE
jgi:hypothetical protein